MLSGFRAILRAMAERSDLGGGGVSELPGMAHVGRTVEGLVAAALRRSILDGTLAPGMRLRYRELAGRFGVSVTPVRVALKELASEGLVEVRPHAGARVSELSGEELEEAMLTRSSIEPWLAFKGAPLLTDDELAAMSRHLEEVRSVTRSLDREGYLRTSWELRHVVYAAARRPRLMARVSVLYELSRRYHHLNLAEHDRLERSLAYMESFHDACAARDGLAAEHVMREALDWTLAYLVEALEHRSPP